MIFFIEIVKKCDVNFNVKKTKSFSRYFIDCRWNLWQNPYIEFIFKFHFQLTNMKNKPDKRKTTIGLKSQSKFFWINGSAQF